MEDVSAIAGPRRNALKIPNDPVLQDHRFLGQGVLPAVYALEHLARAVGRDFPDAALTFADAIQFDKFLALPAAGVPNVAVFADIGPKPDGGIEAVLLTRHVAVKSGITRMKAHARCRFGAAVNGWDTLPSVPAWREAPTETYHLPVDRLYAEMVPFGPAFQNVVSPVQLGPEGARAVVAGGPIDAGGRSLQLGSPFPLDAAFHAACAWSQRFHGIVAFPVAMERRWIRHRTRFGKHYHADIRFRGDTGGLLFFDLWLHDRAGRLCEFIQGLAMRDVSGGRLQPPVWVRCC
jgi:Polyketide synthase dehydratase N-terminal domain